MICIGCFSSICAPNLHVKEPKYGFEYILIKSQTYDKTAYRLSVFDIDKLYLVENRDVSLDRHGYLSVSPEDVVRSICGENTNPMIDLEHVNAIRTDNRMENIRYTINPSWYPGVMNSLPRFIKWDDHHKRFSFEDHPLTQITCALAEKECIPFYAHDTMSPIASCAQKLHNCLHNMLLMFEVALHAHVDYKPGHKVEYDDKMRRKLFADYHSFLAFAHEYDAHNFPKAECISECSPIIYEKENCLKYMDSLVCASNL